MQKKLSPCPIETTLQLIGHKWKVLIIRELLNGTKRFGELKKAIPLISPKVLTQQLRSLEEDNLIVRKVYPEVP
ncbi:MAG TPA: helix-turn-helix transcriptional regulator, partial [Firmicutes bacterium]|nr:helix-turn-helix transcriptional regulator [Bacillota bacterium]